MLNNANNDESYTDNNVSSTTGISSSETIEIIRDNPKKVLELELKLISSAVSTIELIFSSTKIFRSQQKLGTIKALEDVLAKNTISARILMPKADGYSGEDVQRLHKINGLDIRCFNHNSDIRNKTLVVDRAESLVTEIKREEEGNEEGVIDREEKEKYLAIAPQKQKQVQNQTKNSSKEKRT